MSLFLYWMIDWLYGVKLHFQHYFGYITAPSASIHAMLEILLPELHTLIFLSHWLLSHIANVETGEWEMNPVAMTIINPRKEIGLALIKPTTSYSRVLCTTMCYMSPASLWMNHRLQHQCLYLQTIPKKILCSDPLPNNPDHLLFTKRPNFGLVPIGCICRWQNICDSKIEICVHKDRKHCGKRWKCSLPAFLDQSKNLLFGKELK